MRSGVERSARAADPRDCDSADAERRSRLTHSYAVLSACELRCAARSSAIASRASSSARSLRSWPAWPLTQCQCTVWWASAASSRCHRSTFFTGFLSAVRQPLRFQPLIQLDDAVAQILAVGVEVDRAGPLERLQRRDRRHQLHAVVGGVRLAALDLLACARRSAGSRPSRPGPGLPEQAPSVWMIDSVRSAHAQSLASIP